LVIDGNFAVYAMPKKHLSIILVILLTLLLIAVTIWVFEKRIESIELKMKLNDSASIHNEDYSPNMETIIPD